MSRLRSTELLTEQLVSFAWDEWAQMGVFTAPNCVSPWAQDPEALIVFTLEIGRRDPRLFDEVLDWMLANETLFSVRRLRAMCIDQDDRKLVAGTIGWLARQGPRARLKPRREDQAPGLTDLEPLFFGGGPFGDADPDFAAAGLLRSVLLPSGKSTAPDLETSINFAFRLRAILGVGIRAELVRVMLTSHPSPATSQMLARAVGYSKRNVHDALGGLASAQVLMSFPIDGEQRYEINDEIWAALLQRDPAALPVHRDWPQLLGALRLIVRWRAEEEQLRVSKYMKQSGTRQLLVRISRDLAFAGIEVRQGVKAEQAPAEIDRVLDSILHRLNPDYVDR
ncbi:MAG: hypothetical protein WBV77_11980 [Solirubrobacteraceae bacterium]